MKAFSLAVLSLVSATACSQSFDIAPATPVAEHGNSSIGSDGKRTPPPPTSPQKGYAFSFAEKLPPGWRITSRGTNLADAPLTPGYHAICVVSREGTRDQMLFLLETYMDQGKRIEDAAHMQDNAWWETRIPGSFVSKFAQDEAVGLRLASGNFPGADDIQMFTALLCDQDSCEDAIRESDGFAAAMKLTVVAKDDMRVVVPGEQDCGSFF